MKLAFLGMGLMGAPMARNCLNAGHAVTVWNRTPARCMPLREAGATVAESAADATTDAEIVLLCVEDHAAVEQVLFTHHGVAQGLVTKQGQSNGKQVIIIDHSTISPAAEADYAARLLLQCGAQLIDAPVTGGDAGAKAGTLSIMVGGPQDAFERALPVLRAMGKTITHIGGEVGAGQKAKLINQVIVAINLMATTEGMRLGEAAGLDMKCVLAAIEGGAAASWSLSNLGPKWLARDFAPGFRLRHLLKDIRYAIEMLGGIETAIERFPAIKLAHDLLVRADTAGQGDCGTQVLGAAFESNGAA